MENIPSLIEPGTKSFLNHTLRQCHNIKSKYYNELFNMGVFVILTLVVSAILFYKYK